MTLPLTYHLEFSVFLAKWYATLSSLSISMSFVQLQRLHMVELAGELLYENKRQQPVERLSAVLIPGVLFL